MDKRFGDGAPIRVGVIGFSLGGSAFHAPFIATTDGLELAAIVTRDPERQRKAARTYPTARILDAAGQLFAPNAGVDLVAVSTPNRTHVPLTRAAIDAGLHVVVDKPLAPSAAEARAVAADAKERGTLVIPFQNRRWDGDFLTLRRLVDEGAVGTPLRFESGFERWRPTATGGWRERSDPNEAGGLLFDLGTHLIDQALVLFGPAREVYAHLDCRREGVSADDDSFVALTHVSGVRSHLYMSAVAAQPPPRFRLLGTRAAFTKWGIDVQDDALRAGAHPGGADWGIDPPERWGTLGVANEAKPVPTERGDYGGFYRAVVRAMRGEGPPPVAIEDAIATLDVIEAARASASRHDGRLP